MNDDELDPKELAEAEALARALEDVEQGRGPTAEAPVDALQTALLLRHGRGHDALPETRREQLLAELLESVPSVGAQDGGRRPRWLPWTLGGASLAMAAAAAVVMLVQSPAAVMPATSREPVPSRSTALVPAASAALLAAQAKLASEAPQSAHEFHAHMRAYRAAVFRAMEQRYPQRLSMLDERTSARMRLGAKP